jgi:gamma-glutamylcyclotransferase (GGCT)/AIG2-like uncharacterized protein YtfP
MIDLFTYGSLMCSDIINKVAGCRLDFCQARLNGYFRSNIRDKEYPGISPRSGAMVPGVLYLDLSPEAIERLDVFEGELYRRQVVEVVTEHHGFVKAMTYVIKPQHRDLLTNVEWDFNYFLAFGKKKFEETYFGFQDCQGIE